MTGHTERRKDELIERYALQRRKSRVLLGKRESPGQEAEPLELHRGHEETICHEPREALEIKGRRRSPGVSQLPNSRRLLLIQVMDLYRNEIIASRKPLSRAEFECCNELCNGIGHTTKHLFHPCIVNDCSEFATGTMYQRAREAYSIGDHGREHYRHQDILANDGTGFRTRPLLLPGFSA